MNIFEGARRIVKIFYGIGFVVVGLIFVCVAIPDKPTEGAKWMLVLTSIGFPVLWGAVYMIGYIMRGFMGIQKGCDE